MLRYIRNDINKIANSYFDLLPYVTKLQVYTIDRSLSNFKMNFDKKKALYNSLPIFRLFQLHKDFKFQWQSQVVKYLEIHGTQDLTRLDALNYGLISQSILQCLLLTYNKSSFSWLERINITMLKYNINRIKIYTLPNLLIFQTVLRKTSLTLSELGELSTLNVEFFWGA